MRQDSKAYISKNDSHDSHYHILPAQTPTEATWYRGSADAVRRNLPVILEDYRGALLPDDLLILSGQALYRMVRAPQGPPRSCTSSKHFVSAKPDGVRADALVQQGRQQ